MTRPLKGPRLGIDMGGTTITAVIADQGCKLLGVAQGLTGDHTHVAPTVGRIIALANHALRESGVDRSSIVCAGIGMPGEIDPVTGHLRSSPILPTWRDVDIAGLLNERTGLTFLVENDANAALLAEGLFGAAQHVDPVLLITIGTGIGGAVMANGQLLRGFKGSAGEIGHIPVHCMGLKCWCGGLDCLGLYASATAIVDRYKAIAKLTQTEVDGHLLAARFIEGNDAARQAVEAAAFYLARGIAQASCIIAPEAVILHGGLVQGLGAFLVSAVTGHLRRRSYPAAVGAVSVCAAGLGEYSGALGASLIPPLDGQ